MKTAQKSGELHCLPSPLHQFPPPWEDSKTPASSCSSAATCQVAQSSRQTWRGHSWPGLPHSQRSHCDHQDRRQQKGRLSLGLSTEYFMIPWWKESKVSTHGFILNCWMDITWWTAWKEKTLLNTHFEWVSFLILITYRKQDKRVYKLLLRQGNGLLQPKSFLTFSLTCFFKTFIEFFSFSYNTYSKQKKGNYRKL